MGGIKKNLKLFIYKNSMLPLQFTNEPQLLFSVVIVVSDHFLRQPM